MQRIFHQLTGLSGNGADGTMSVNIPAGRKYHNLHIRLASGTCTAAMITQVRVFANDDNIMLLSGTQLDALNQYMKGAAYSTDSDLVVPFDLVGSKDIVALYSTALNVGPVDRDIVDPQTGKVMHKGTGQAIFTARLEFDVSGATTPNFEVWADSTPATDEGPGAIPRIKSLKYSAASGESSYDRLPFGTAQSRLWRFLLMKTSTGTLTSLRIVQDTNRFEDKAPKVVNDRAINREGIRDTTGASSYWTYCKDWGYSGVSEYLDTLGANDITIFPTCGSANDLTLLHGTIGGL